MTCRPKGGSKKVIILFKFVANKKKRKLIEVKEDAVQRKSGTEVWGNQNTRKISQSSNSYT